MKNFKIEFSTHNLNAFDVHTKTYCSEIFNAESKEEACELFDKKYLNTLTCIHLIINIYEVFEYIVCYTTIDDDVDYLYPDMNDETIFAVNKEEAKKEFLNNHKSFMNRNYAIDHIYTLEELLNEP